MVAGRDLKGWVGGGGETFFESGESRQTGEGGGDGVPELQARGPLLQIEGGEAVLSSAEAPIACPYGRGLYWGLRLRLRVLYWGWI
jgi:hypothetical protein